MDGIPNKVKGWITDTHFKRTWFALLDEEDRIAWALMFEHQ